MDVEAWGERAGRCLVTRAKSDADAPERSPITEKDTLEGLFDPKVTGDKSGGFAMVDLARRLAFAERRHRQGQTVGEIWRSIVGDWVNRGVTFAEAQDEVEVAEKEGREGKR